VKVLALDYGAARTGVAVSDPTGTLARPLRVVERAASGDGMKELAELVWTSAAGLQAGAELYGPADLAELPCRERGRWTVAAPEGFDAAVEPEAYVAAFGPEVGSWARLVPVQGPRTRFSVVVGPLGDAWRVLGTDPVPTR
jgi:hypothetical protein